MPDSGQIWENLAFPRSSPQDLGAMMALFRAAFPDEDVLGLISGLMTAPSGVLSLLGPLAVAPDW